MSVISNNLKYLRRVSGLTQEQFAQRIGTKRANVGAYEEARAVPPVDTLQTIAGTFGISVDDFLKKDIKTLREARDLPLGFDTQPVYGHHSYEKSNLSIDFPTGSGNNEQASGHHDKVEVKPAFEPDISFKVPVVENKQPRNIIQLIRRFQFNDYLMKSRDANFLKTLTEFHLPNLPIGEYRAFEAAEDFAFEGALLIGSLVKNWYDIADGKNYVLVTKAQGIMYRRVYNQVKIKGTLLVSSDNLRFPSAEISINDVIETWEIRAFISHTLPEPSINFDKLNHLANELKFELDRLKK